MRKNTSAFHVSRQDATLGLFCSQVAKKTSKIHLIAWYLYLCLQISITIHFFEGHFLKIFFFLFNWARSTIQQHLQYHSILIYILKGFTEEFVHILLRFFFFLFLKQWCKSIFFWLLAVFSDLWRDREIQNTFTLICQ